MSGPSHASIRVPRLLSTRSLARAYAATVAVSLPAIVGVYLAFPGARRTLTFENQVLESIQVALYLLALAAGVAALLAWRGRSSESRIPLAGIVPVLAIVAALEELAWGQNLFGWEKLEIEGETISAFGDIPEVIVALLGAAGRPLGVVLALALVASLLIGAYRARGALGRGLGHLLAHPPLRFVLLWAALVVAAAGVDKLALRVAFELVGQDDILFGHELAIEETLESYAALALAFAALALLGAAAGSRARVARPRG